MLFRRHKKDSLLNGAVPLNEADSAEGEELTEVTQEEAAEAQLAQTGGKEDVDLDAIAEKHLIQMGEGEEEDTEEVKEILSQLQSEKPSDKKEEHPETVSEKVDEQVKSEAENKGEIGLLSDLFEQEEDEEASHLDSLIASLPDNTMEELFNDVQEVELLIHEWQQRRR